MSDTKKNLDDASTGGGIGDIPAQPFEETSPSIDPNNTDTDTDGEGDNGVVRGEVLSVDDDATPSGEDPDETADETLGQTP